MNMVQCKHRINLALAFLVLQSENISMQTLALTFKTCFASQSSWFNPLYYISDAHLIYAIIFHYLPFSVCVDPYYSRLDLKYEWISYTLKWPCGVSNGFFDEKARVRGNRVLADTCCFSWLDYIQRFFSGEVKIFISSTVVIFMFYTVKQSSLKNDPHFDVFTGQ